MRPDLENAPDRRYDWALCRALRWPAVEAWAELASGSAARTTNVTARNLFMVLPLWSCGGGAISRGTRRLPLLSSTSGARRDSHRHLSRRLSPERERRRAGRAGQPTVARFPRQGPV